MENKCFVLMPFKDPYNDYYKQILVPAIQAARLEPIRADEIYGTRPIIEDIIKEIRDASALVADVTEKNPNVNYELGFAHALGRPVVIISQSMDDIPFDYRHVRAIIYDTRETDWASKLKDKITNTLRLIEPRSDKVTFSPFLDEVSKEIITKINEQWISREDEIRRFFDQTLHKMVAGDHSALKKYLHESNLKFLAGELFDEARLEFPWDVNITAINFKGDYIYHFNEKMIGRRFRRKKPYSEILDKKTGELFFVNYSRSERFKFLLRDKQFKPTRFTKLYFHEIEHLQAIVIFESHINVLPELPKVNFQDLYYFTNSKQNDGKVLITKPEHKERVLYKIVCEGTYPNHLENADFWIVVVPFNFPNYHPQPGRAIKSANGKWHGISYVGSSEKHNIGETFIINIIQTTPEATEAFRKYLQENATKEPKEQWYGLDALPKGCSIHDSVTVIRK